MTGLTIEEAMAVAVLKGDRVAAYALADRLAEERGGDVRAAAQKAMRGPPARVVDGHAAYHWPEFRTFCERLGIAWELPTTRLTIRLDVEGPVEVEHLYRGAAVTPASAKAEGT